MDTLIEAIERTGNPSVVGLDPTPALVPQIVVEELADEVADSLDTEADAGAETDADASTGARSDISTNAGANSNLYATTALALAYFEFNRAIIDAIADIVPAVKPQIAMYESLGTAGLDTYVMTCQYAQERGLYVLGDIKRGDIGSTAAAYATHLSGGAVSTYSGVAGPTAHWYEDAVTINPYLGSDGVQPFLDVAAEHNADVFALVRTSNPSSAQIQELMLADGKAVYEQVADEVSRWGESTIGKYGYSRLGAVVGATHPEQGKALRKRMPYTFFLVPGYGAQGGSAADVAGMFDAEGRGAIINSSRGIIGAWRKQGSQQTTAQQASAQHTSAQGSAQPAEQGFLSAQDALDHVALSARHAAEAMRDDIQTALATRA